MRAAAAASGSSAAPAVGCGDGPCAVEAVRASNLVLHIHFSELVFDRLIATNGASKGVAFLGIVGCHFEGAGGAAQLFEGEQDSRMIQDLVIQHFAVARVSKTRGRCLVEDDQPRIA